MAAGVACSASTGQAEFIAGIHDCRGWWVIGRSQESDLEKELTSIGNRLAITSNKGKSPRQLGNIHHKMRVGQALVCPVHCADRDGC